MGLVPYRDSSIVDRTYSNAFQNNGIATATGKDSIANVIKSAAASIFSEIYDALYDIDNNLMLSTASGGYLERWGEFLGENRNKVSFAKDYSYSNAYIEIRIGDAETTAAAVTIDASDIRIPSGVELTSSDGTMTVVTVSDTIIASDSGIGYCQVKCDNPTVVLIPASTLIKCNYNIASVDNIDPNISSRLKITAGNRLDIIGGYQSMSDQEYRFALTKKAEGLGTGNLSAVETALNKVPDLIRFTIFEHTHGNASVSVFIEAKDLIFPASVLRNVQITMKRIVSVGTRVFVYQPILRSVQLVVEVTGVDLTDTDKENMASAVKVFVNDIPTGVGTTVEELASEMSKVINKEGAILSTNRVFIGNREIDPGDIPIRFNEKLVMNSIDSLVFV